MKIWVLKVDTESGDHYLDGYFTKKPSKSAIDKFMRKRYAEEIDEEGSLLAYPELFELEEKSIEDDR